MCIYFPDLPLICGCPDCRVCVDRELPLPLPSAFPAARAERWRDLISPDDSERLAIVLDVSLEAPLLGPGAALIIRSA